MAVNFLKNIPKKVYKHLLDFAAQTVLHGPKYFLNRGTIEGGKEIKTKNQRIEINMSKFDK